VGDAKSSLCDAESLLGDARSSLGDAESSLGDGKSSLGDAESSVGDAKSLPGGAYISLGDAKSPVVQDTLLAAAIAHKTVLAGALGAVNRFQVDVSNENAILRSEAAATLYVPLLGRNGKGAWAAAVRLSWAKPRVFAAPLLDDEVVRAATVLADMAVHVLNTHRDLLAE
jgi:hypothetical protein